MSGRGAVGADHCTAELTTRHRPVATREEVRVNKPLLLVAVAAVAAVIATKRRQAQADAAALWREATSDASR
jgi:hypothetical protein